MSARSGSVAASDRANHPTACFNCRSARQKCNRIEPCERCSTHILACRFPPRSYRGRKQGSTNKPDTVEKLLTRISESTVGEEVIAAILRREQRKDKNASSRDSSSENGTPHDSLIYSPLQILAAAVEADRDAHSSPSTNLPGDGQSPEAVASRLGHGLSPSFRGSHPTTTTAFTDERLAKYFSPRTSDRTDWEMLALQPLQSTFRLDTAAFDPVSARLVSEADIVHYFQLFYEYRNPYVGLLDPSLHTPEFVRAASFTLFSVICASGCGMSTNQRDRILYTPLMSLAEENIKWSMGVGVGSIETIQAITYMAYGAPAAERQCDDPYWLRIAHATQLARELGINRPDMYACRIKAQSSANAETQERLIRNVERTWLYTFIVDKSFGVTTGRIMSVSWREIPSNTSDWWTKPSASPLDRIVSGLVDMRVVFLKQLENRNRLRKSSESILQWHAKASSTLRDLCASWCDNVNYDEPSAEYLPILRSYMTHARLVVNGQSLRDLIALEKNPENAKSVSHMSQQTVDVAVEYIDMLTTQDYLRRYAKGISNTTFIQACHAATEVLLAIKRSAIPSDAIPHAASKIKAIADHLEALTRILPASSWASIYARLARSFVYQLNDLTVKAGEDSMDTTDSYARPLADNNSLDADYWWKQPQPWLGLDGNGFDLANVYGLGFAGDELDFTSMNFMNSL